MTHRVTPHRLRHGLAHKVDITVATIADRDAIPQYRRRWSMVVGVYDDGSNNGLYILEKNNDHRSDNSNWERLSVDEYEHPTGFSDQPTEDDGVVTQVEVSDEGHVTGAKKASIKETSKVSTKATTKVSTKDTTKTGTKQTSKVDTKPTSKVSTKGTAKVDTKATSKISTKNTSKVSTKDTSKISTKPTSKVNTKDTSKLSVKETSKVETQDLPTEDMPFRFDHRSYGLLYSEA